MKSCILKNSALLHSSPRGRRSGWHEWPWNQSLRKGRWKNVFSDILSSLHRDGGGKGSQRVVFAVRGINCVDQWQKKASRCWPSRVNSRGTTTARRARGGGGFGGCSRQALLNYTRVASRRHWCTVHNCALLRSHGRSCEAVVQCGVVKRGLHRSDAVQWKHVQRPHIMRIYPEPLKI